MDSGEGRESSAELQVARRHRRALSMRSRLWLPGFELEAMHPLCAILTASWMKRDKRRGAKIKFGNSAMVQNLNL